MTCGNEECIIIINAARALLICLSDANSYMATL